MIETPQLLAGLEDACTEAASMALAGKKGAEREIKPDGSIVTSMDKAAERHIRSEIERMSPGAAVWGEEYGYTPPNVDGLWLIDPIDGTSNYAFGQPLWGVTAALYRDGRLQLGCICIPELGWVFTGEAGKGARLNGKRLPAVQSGPIQPFELVVHGDVKNTLERSYPGKVRHLGSFVVEAAIFLTGGMRVLLTNGVKLYDAAAGILMAREVGADIRELDGRPFDESEWVEPKRCRTFGFFPPDSGWPFQSQ